MEEKGKREGKREEKREGERERREERKEEERGGIRETELTPLKEKMGREREYRLKEAGDPLV